MITAVCHIFWSWLFISYLSLEVKGAAIAINITYITSFIMQEIYVRCIAYQSFKYMMVPFFVKGTFQHWCAFLKYGAPSSALQCFEWWAYELLVIFAGYLGNASISGMVAVINIISLIYMIPMGVQ
jgi:MATE family multidrug resistance protein